MKTEKILSTLLIAMVLTAGCASKGSEVVDETKEGEKKAKTVQSDTADAKTTDQGTITSDTKDASTKDLNGENQDQNVQEMMEVQDKAENIYFDYDKFNIRADMQETLEKNAVVLKDRRVVVVGHCDEWGSDEYNFALGLRRANSVKKALIGQGHNADSITPKTVGESMPVCTEKTQECWQKNRRVEFEVLP